MTIDSITLRSGTGKVGEIKGEIIFESPAGLTVVCVENEYEIPRRLIENIERALICGWFLLCPELAVDLAGHPTMGAVPICKTHRTWLDKQPS